MDINELLFIAHSETSGDIGSVKHDLVTFMAVENGMCRFTRSQTFNYRPSIPDVKLQLDFVMEEKHPLLGIAFTICLFVPPVEMQPLIFILQQKLNHTMLAHFSNHHSTLHNNCQWKTCWTNCKTLNYFLLSLDKFNFQKTQDFCTGLVSCFMMNFREPTINVT